MHEYSIRDESKRIIDNWKSLFSHTSHTLHMHSSTQYKVFKRFLAEMLLVAYLFASAVGLFLCRRGTWHYQKWFPSFTHFFWVEPSLEHQVLTGPHNYKWNRDWKCIIYLLSSIVNRCLVLSTRSEKCVCIYVYFYMQVCICLYTLCVCVCVSCLSFFLFLCRVVQMLEVKWRHYRTVGKSHHKRTMLE